MGARSMIEAAGGTIQITAKPEAAKKPKKEKKAKPPAEDAAKGGEGAKA